MKRLSVILSLWSLLTLAGLGRPAQANEVRQWSLQILQSDAHHLLLELHLPTFNEETLYLEDKAYQRLTVGEEWGRWGRPGQPLLPAYTLPIGLPQSASPQITLLAAERETLSGYNLYPRPTFVRTGDAASPQLIERAKPDPSAYQKDATLPGYLIEAADQGAIREQALFRLRLYPFQYNPARQELTVARRLKVLVTFAPTLTTTSEPVSIAPPFGHLLAQTLVNFDALPLSSASSERAVLAPQTGPGQGVINSSSGGDYVIITHPDFYDSIQELAAYRAAQGLQVVVVKTPEIYEKYGNGQKKPEAIRDYLADAYQSWSVKPIYVLLVGDGDASAVITDPAAPTVITGYTDVPTDFVPSHYESLLVFGLAPLDIWYTKVTQTAGVYDDDPDLFIGRIPVRSANEVVAVTEKIKAYEQGGSNGNWAHQVVLVADDDIPDFRGDMETIAGFLPTSLTPTKIYGSGLEVETAVNNGALIIAYSGHGSRTKWGNWAHEPSAFYQMGQIQSMSNANKYPFLTVTNCSNGYFTHPTTHRVFAEEFLLATNKGGVAAWAAAAYSFPSVNTPINEALYRALFLENNLTLSAAAVQALVEAQAENWYLDRNLFEAYTFFGDPALRLALTSLMPPTAKFISSSPDKLGQATTFTPFSLGVDHRYSWNFGDGITSSLPNPAHTYGAVGTYVVQFTTTNSAGSNSITGTVTIETELAPSDALNIFLPVILK